MNFDFITVWWNGVCTENFEKMKVTVKRNIIPIAASVLLVGIAFIAITIVDFKQINPEGNTVPIFFKCNDTTLVRDNSIFCNTNRSLFGVENFVQPTPTIKSE